MNDVKKGNFYQATRLTKNQISLPINITHNFATIIATLSLESKHYKSSVYHFLEAIGTIGGIYELLFQGILIMYISIRKSLYFYSFLAELNKFAAHRYQNKDHRTNDDNHQYMNNRVSRGDQQRPKAVMFRKFLNEDGEAKTEDNK